MESLLKMSGLLTEEREPLTPEEGLIGKELSMGRICMFCWASLTRTFPAELVLFEATGVLSDTLVFFGADGPEGRPGDRYGQLGAAVCLW